MFIFTVSLDFFSNYSKVSDFLFKHLLPIEKLKVRIQTMIIFTTTSNFSSLILFIKSTEILKYKQDFP